MVHRLLLDEPGRRELLIGDEAIVRGAIEARVALVSGYPGTPASEVGDTFHRLYRELGISFEYSVNEKVALELAFGASLAGARTLVSMKHLGLNSAADPLSTMPYIGVRGGMVIVSAGDPGCMTSPNEQDQRHLGRMVGVPTLDPASPDEARRMTVFAYELSEACELPVLLRITTRVCHTRAPVEFGPRVPPRLPAAFVKDPARNVPVPVNARRMRETLFQRLERARTAMAASPFNPRSGPPTGRRGIVAAGAPRNAAIEALRRAGVEVPLLEIGTVHPFPYALAVEFLRAVDEVLVLEELSPYVEDVLLASAHRAGVPTRVHGKRDGHAPWFHELEMGEVERRVRAFLELPPAPRATVEPLPAGFAPPPRPPVLCSGCPHRNSFHTVTAVFGDTPVYVNDIGCYTLGMSPPHHAGDTLLAMGSSIPMAAGIARATGKRTVAFLGDSTFFHSGMPPLVDAIEQDDDVTVIVLDNHVTAMTGLQPSPSRRIGDVARALGARDVSVVDASDLPALLAAFGRAKEARGLSVVVVEGPCALLAAREHPAAEKTLPMIDPDRCHTCGMKEAGLGCGLDPSPAVMRRVAVQRAASNGVLGASAAEPATSPCSLECPLGICIPSYVGAIAAGSPGRGVRAVEVRAALPSVCAYVCHRPCESACVLASEDGSIAVNALKRHLMDRHRGAPAEQRPIPSGLSVAVVGAGPAGLAAARELVRRGYAPTVLDAHGRPGGMLEHAIPAYRLPRDVLRRDIDAVLAEGVRFEGGVRVGRDVTLEDLRRRGFRAILLALGAQQGTRPPVPGAHLDGAIDALAFLAEGAPCDGESVVVVGGGDVAIDAARVALRRGAERVTIVCPEGEDEISAAAETVRDALREGAVLRPGNAVLGIEAGVDSGPDSSAGGRVARVLLGRVVGFARTDDGAVRWDRAEPAGEIAAARVVFATGQRPVVDGLDLPAGLVLTSGRVDADDCGRTCVPDLFAAGDVATGPSTVTEAMAAGVRAAWAIDVFLANGRDVRGPSAPPRRVRRRDERAAASHVTPASLEPDDALAEAQRCRLCGMCRNCRTCVELLACPAITRAGRDERPEILQELCTACGACVQACPNDAITVPA